MVTLVHAAFAQMPRRRVGLLQNTLFLRHFLRVRHLGLSQLLRLWTDQKVLFQLQTSKFIVTGVKQYELFWKQKLGSITVLTEKEKKSTALLGWPRKMYKLDRMHNSTEYPRSLFHFIKRLVYKIGQDFLDVQYSTGIFFIFSSVGKGDLNSW